MKKPTPQLQRIMYSREDIVDSMKAMEEQLELRIDYLQKEADTITLEIDALVDAEEAVKVARAEIENIDDES